MRTTNLDQSKDGEIATAVVEVLTEAGYSAEEAIPGLIQAVLLLAESIPDTDGALDEAANLLADGPAGDEYWE